MENDCVIGVYCCFAETTLSKKAHKINEFHVSVEFVL